MVSRFVYAQLQTSNFTAAKSFYRDLLGWSVQDDPPGGPPYAEIRANADSIGGIMPNPPGATGSRWLPYLSTDDLDATVQKAGELGATILMPPTNIPTKGVRVSVLRDPTGADFALRGPVSSHAEENQRDRTTAAKRIVDFPLSAFAGMTVANGSRSLRGCRGVART